VWVIQAGQRRHLSPKFIEHALKHDWEGGERQSQRYQAGRNAGSWPDQTQSSRTNHMPK
jgi:hypothetical protein